MRLTIGMAFIDDYHGMYFTIQHIRDNMVALEQMVKSGVINTEKAPWAKPRLKDIEFVLVDNRPSFPGRKLPDGSMIPMPSHSRDAKFFLAEKINNKLNMECRYIPMSDPQGTSPSRERIFTEARGDAVLCLDSHVIVRLGGIERLMQFYEDHPDTKDMYSGPHLYDDLQQYNTHFDDFWRGGMWGIWGWAWQCGCGPDGVRFTFHGIEDGQPWRPYHLSMGFTPITSCNKCGKMIPHDFSDSNMKLKGYKKLGTDPDEPPFEIPGNGLGLFSCRKDAWLHFHPGSRNFGGEELYIHEKFRQAGHKCWCLPFLTWVHRYAKPDGQKYPTYSYNKVRNYVLQAADIGQDLETIKEHFVSGKRLPDTINEAEWEHLLKDPLLHTLDTLPKDEQPAAPVKSKSGREQPPATAKTIEAVFDWMKPIKRDLNEHGDKLRELAAKCSRVTELTTRRESTIALLAGKPTKFTSYQSERDEQDLYEYLKSLLPETECHINYVTREDFIAGRPETIDETDLLFIDTVHTAAVIKSELDRFAPMTTRYIVIHDTKSNGFRGEDGGEGLLDSIRPWLENNDQWFPAFHTEKQFGLTVLSCNMADWPDKPVHPGLLGFGPGTELKKILRSFGVEAQPGCDCNRKTAEMDLHGVAGCRERFNEIVGFMRDGEKRFKWQEKLHAAIKAPFAEPMLCIKLATHFSDYWPVLIEECIKRAEAHEQKKLFAREKMSRRED